MRLHRQQTRTVQRSERKTRPARSHWSPALATRRQFYRCSFACQLVRSQLNFCTRMARNNAALNFSSSNHQGGLSHSPPGQSSALAVASALVTLGNPRRPSIDLNNPKDTNTKSNKRKQSQHPDNL
jgi:hypothetical protein